MIVRTTTEITDTEVVLGDGRRIPAELVVGSAEARLANPCASYTNPVAKIFCEIASA